VKGYEVTVKVRDIAGALDTFEVLAGSHEQAAVEGIRLFREKHPRWNTYELESPDTDTSEMLTKKLLAQRPIIGPARHPLEAMLFSQRELQINSYGFDPSEPPSDEARIEFIRWNVLALTDELHELLGECGWKPWATSRHVNADAAMAELVDAWHFFMNLMWAVEGGGLLGDAGALADVFQARYFEKRARNAKRQDEGYTGLEKCPVCKRALDDPTTKCDRFNCAEIGV
jgi:hypothetical protein